MILGDINNRKKAPDVIKVIIFLILSSAVTGCVVLPISRTYFEPDDSTGLPVQTASCGWHATKKDALRKNNQGITHTFHPPKNANSTENLSIDIVIGKTDRNIEISTSQAHLKVLPDNETFKVSESKIENAGPNFYKQIYLEFPIKTYAVDGFELFIDSSFYVIDGSSTKSTLIRFNRKTKMDVYYGSINC